MEKPQPRAEPFSHPLEGSPPPPPPPLPPPPGEKRFRLWYVGCSCLDRRTTLPMLPWLMAEIRRRSQKPEPSAVPPREVLLLLGSPTLRCVPSSSSSAAASASNPAVFIFEHKAQHIARFVHNSHDLTYFAYLIKAQPEDPDSRMACHVFRAAEPGQVPDVISSIRQASKAALKEDVKPNKDSEDAFYNSQKFEVLYCGKVTVAHKKAPSTLIDDCIEKFSLHERQRLKLLSEHRNSESSTDLAGGDGDIPTSPFDSPFEEEEEADSPDGGKTGMFIVGSQTNLASLASCRVSFPERILEDSGFDDQQEFRSRCSSVTGVMQRKTHDNSKTQSRRRHASAPSHVQPSDSEKNRTMLFQVGRFEINLISPDTKSVVFEKNFKDISSCSQGIKHIDHFGFICRESIETGISQYVCYVFQCASESLVDEVMLTLKQAFSTAAALQNAKTQIKLCEACPMHSLHKLCERIEGLYPPRAKLVIQRHLSSLSDNEQADIFERVQKMKPISDQEENELVILHLRQLCEAKQKTHVHIGEAPVQNASNNTIPENAASGGRFKLDILKNKAKKSLTSSLENIFSRGANRMRGRLGSMDSFERCNNLTSDKDCSSGESPPLTPPASPISSAWQPFPEEDSDSPQFRRRAHTFSHPPSSSKKRITFQEGRSQSVKSPLLRQNSVEHGSDGERRKRTSSVCSNDSLNAGGITLTPRRISWRQRIFLRVASPIKKSPSAMQLQDGMDGNELLPLSPLAPCFDEDPLISILQNDDGQEKSGEKKNSEELQSLWRKAIHQQILLLRMEKENQKLEASRDELQSRKVKMDYEEVGTCQKDVINIWDKKLSNFRAKIKCDMEDIHATLKDGVPKGRRGEIWQFLAVQHRVRHRLPNKQQPPDISYKELLKQLTVQQHAILVDLGRTFPTHPYFSAQLGAGQLSLFNLLKAYSLLDKEVGYCQGISFVAGVLLLHMSEEQAFEMLKFLMYDLGFRKQYRPDMMSLQIQMYQLSRLLHDYHRDLYNHLEENEISPSLYAAPWFLTLFASQFPLGFVARVFDIIFLQGTEVIFKVALSLLSSHEEPIMMCETFESIVEFLKNTLPDMSKPQMEKIMTQVFEMDISKQLHAYEVEYHVLQDELQENTNPCDEGEVPEKLERANNQLKRQNMDLLEKLQVAHAKIQSMESHLEDALARENKMKSLIQSLEKEKAFYQMTVEKLCRYLPDEALSDCRQLLKEVNCSPSKILK
ncbi:TBC1 domain family member 4 isoform X2 [Anolis carolinensis]|uniref:TBC1 domain family member 4 isoform X2 n=1 Tax=Anolis carolinensis TaxID=28377 RepID=UPI000462A6FC|nr:PREDICTED: TBC1 domain family member 4 isoform X3 [Anolis carolinensis]|eukprot:XP_008105100.1 PREDICTED: TBC1 domain family member 4 isoform X3 [Anolis carolinensis]